MQSTLDLARPTVTEELAVAAQTPALSLGKLRGCGADDFSYNRAG